VPVEVREWIAPALASPDFVLKDGTGHRFDRRVRPARRSQARASRRARLAHGRDAERGARVVAVGRSEKLTQAGTDRADQPGVPTVAKLFRHNLAGAGSQWPPDLPLDPMACFRQLLILSQWGVRDLLPIRPSSRRRARDRRTRAGATGTDRWWPICRRRNRR